MRTITEKLNSKFAEDLLTTFTVRAGDEVFGIVNGFEEGYNAFKELYYLSKEHKVPLYVGVGVGDVLAKNLMKPDEVNGQAIWNSADALGFLKSSNHNFKNKVKPIQTLDKNLKFMFLIGRNFEDSMIVNYMLYFILEKVMKRTPKQTEVVRLIESLPLLTYEEVGLKLEYKKEHAQANVSKILARADYNVVKDAEHELLKLINLIYDRKKNE